MVPKGHASQHLSFLFFPFATLRVARERQGFPVCFSSFHSSSMPIKEKEFPAPLRQTHSDPAMMLLCPRPPYLRLTSPFLRACFRNGSPHGSAMRPAQADVSGGPST